MTDEYTEQKIRVYKAQKKNSDSGLSKYMVKPMQKLMGMKPKDESGKKGRLTA